MEWKFEEKFYGWKRSTCAGVDYTFHSPNYFYVWVDGFEIIRW